MLNREDKQNKYFYTYEVFNEKLSRKVKKYEKAPEGKEDSDAFDVEVDGRFIIYSCGDELVIQSVRVHEPILKYLKPRYQQAELKENPARIASLRQTFIEKIQKNIRNFELLLPEQEKQKWHLLLLMLKKIEFGYENKRLIINNKEFLRL